MNPHRAKLAPALFLLAALGAAAPPRCPAAEHPLPSAKPEAFGVSAATLDRIDGAVRAALERGQLPGAVVLIAHRGKVIFRRAYGWRSKEPVPTLMGPGTVFDLASLTKPI